MIILKKINNNINYLRLIKKNYYSRDNNINNSKSNPRYKKLNYNHSTEFLRFNDDFRRKAVKKI